MWCIANIRDFGGPDGSRHGIKLMTQNKVSVARLMKVAYTDCLMVMDERVRLLFERFF